MSEVTRYSEGDYMDPRPFPHKHGDWVEYEAYQNLEAQLAEMREAIKQFAYNQRWAHQMWKDQPAIKPLFDIAEALAGQGGSDEEVG